MVLVDEMANRTASDNQHLQDEGALEMKRNLVLAVLLVGMGVMTSFFIEGCGISSKKPEQHGSSRQQSYRPTTAIEPQVPAYARDMAKTPSGLLYQVIEAGQSAQRPQAGQTVSVHYTGTLPNGTVFDSSYQKGSPIQFPVGRGVVIRGWDEAILAMTVGERRKLVVPPHLAYGAQSPSPLIPANATLIFDVRLVSID